MPFGSSAYGPAELRSRRIDLDTYSERRNQLKASACAPAHCSKDRGERPAISATVGKSSDSSSVRPTKKSKQAANRLIGQVDGAPSSIHRGCFELHEELWHRETGHAEERAGEAPGGIPETFGDRSELLEQSVDVGGVHVQANNVPQGHVRVGQNRLQEPPASCSATPPRK